ncbi:hypothetical protein Pth03_32040 [Planotetraspora thailandica]|uniref:Uncharacterized protein n=1 Tax=Planotetraspora thailandica TaxID=487172 RepID=A0A8J3XWC0_9ACTN|nr:hypothetical protein [Planotetraspora thailandica]GII54815.1 hypothetical protein Pth03_32040 [Planotetraspora thailandica]
MSRASITLALLRPLIRAIDWVPLAVTVSISLCLAAGMEPGDPLEPGLGLLILRTSAILLGSAAAFALTDAMAPSSAAAAPVPRWLRQWERTLLAGAASALGWGLTSAIVVARLAPGATLGFPGTALEAAICLLAGPAAAAVAVRRYPGKPAALTGAFFLFTGWAAMQLTGPAAWAGPYGGQGNAALWWAAALVVALVVLAAAHRDVRR